MDNNNPAQAPMPNTQPAQPSPQTPIPSAPAERQTSQPRLTVAENSNKLILWLVIGLVVIVALIGGIYLFLSNQQAAPEPPTISSPAPARSAQETREIDLDSIDVDSTANSIESDFTQLDQDLQQL